MALFDVTQYETPKLSVVDINKTTEDVGIFLVAYQTARIRVGQPREPKLTASLSLIPSFSNQFHSSTEEAVIENDENQREFVKLHTLFISATAAIIHPFKPDVTEKRRNIFELRFIHGLTYEDIADRVSNHRDIVANEAKEGLIQFANALDLVTRRKI